MTERATTWGCRGCGAFASTLGDLPAGWITIRADLGNGPEYCPSCTGLPGGLERVEARAESYASDAQIAAARSLHCQGSDNSVEVDPGALLSDCGDGSYWVQGWLRVAGVGYGLSCSWCDGGIEGAAAPGVWERTSFVEGAPYGIDWLAGGESADLICRECWTTAEENGNV